MDDFKEVVDEQLSHKPILFQVQQSREFGSETNSYTKDEYISILVPTHTWGILKHFMRKLSSQSLCYYCCRVVRGRLVMFLQSSQRSASR